MTRSPTANLVTPSPTAAMVPAISWPKMRGRGVGADVNLLEVGAADAAGGDLDQQLAGADAGTGTVSTRMSLMPR